MSAARILMVLTSHDEMGNTGHKTGFWAEEFAAPYYTFLDAGCEITLATPKGGAAPIDPNSENEDAQTDATRRFYADDEARARIANTARLADMRAEEFDTVFYPGGHGPLWDLTDNQDSISLLEDFLRQQKPIASVCHAPTAFLNLKDEQGEFVIKGKKVAGFTNEEEAAVGLTDVVPHLLEDELKRRGAEYQKVEAFAPFAVVDGLVITGQNPASSEAVAEKLLDALKG
ncbi:type 1 glutamine amidotransferase domain-containing protein [Kushneria marisflavi]|uniref:Type 1 glutamine amidotransferase domain-containing protein n=1 Tax=Kushneria marisflavi TaxID=157779 RepID=A0A240US91_9GAMM|nr:type 1 glutamine amidotransferase domain-containing protein [Kushneria marisflavi]ART64354.1 type 1 glutamine amidotransferase domain-containing protein [Kushneria marisflavi]RKD76822.1 putative intracellular protease/amidase [Kushneria marisflavi]